jgi:hypothetical protein
LVTENGTLWLEQAAEHACDPRLDAWNVGKLQSAIPGMEDRSDKKYIRFTPRKQAKKGMYRLDDRQPVQELL